MAKKINFEKITLRLNISSRGGGIEINLTKLGFKGDKMTAYQNYLGGGMLGRICSDNTLRASGKNCTEEQKERLNYISEELKKYYHTLSNPDTEFEGCSYEENQRLPISAY